MPRDRFQKQSLGALYPVIKQSRILLIGAGGVGCELLKNLVLVGFGEIHVVDLDTIDLSNLNRQFLFRHEHIKRSKALVAKESAQKFNPNVKIEAHHANIKDPQFTIDWFRSFQLVFNALDNLEARRHVNKICLAAAVPLIESGTTGYNGQVQVIKGGKTECYDCNPKETPKTFPVCTIRSTPSQPIHCIVWAKSYLFAEIFGTSEDESPELDTSENSENSEEIENLKQEAEALKRIRNSMGSEEFPRKVFDKVFKEDIERLQSMEDMWKTRKAPETLDFEEISKDAANVQDGIAEQDQAVWTLAENFKVFSDSLRRLSSRLETLKAEATSENKEPVLSFDKDDEDILDFVASTANLRSIVFGIEQRSQFDIKEMAGNIIPAIATTNAMAAGLCVLQAFKVLRDLYSEARTIFLVKSTDRIFSSEPLRPPKPDCPVCGIAQARLEVDLSRATLHDLVEDVLRLKLGYGEELSISSDEGLLYDPDLTDNLDKKLSDLSIKQDSFLTVIDEEDNEPRVNLVFTISEKALPHDTNPINLTEAVEIARKPKPQPAEANGIENGNGETHAAPNGVSKRKREADGDFDTVNIATKREKIEQSTVLKSGSGTAADGDGDEVVVINDNVHNGAIVIE